MAEELIICESGGPRLPREVIVSKVAIIGMSGSGKTQTARKRARMTTDKGAALAELVRHMVASIVDTPAEVRVQRLQMNGYVQLNVRVATQREVGQVIGKGGRNVRSLRQLLNSAASLRGVHCELVMDGDTEAKR